MRGLIKMLVNPIYSLGHRTVAALLLKPFKTYLYTVDYKTKLFVGLFFIGFMTRFDFLDFLVLLCLMQNELISLIVILADNRDSGYK